MLVPILFVSLHRYTFVNIWSNPLNFNSMARIYGLNGALRGRQGNNVYSVQNGTQVVKAYQPVVTNPRSLPQREQRAKFALAGKMSGVTPILALSGLAGSNSRAKRARFVQSILRAASVSGDMNALTAAVALQDVIYSEGSLGVWSAGHSVSASWGTGSLTRDNVVASYIPGNVPSSAPFGYRELAIICLYDASSSTLEEVQVADIATFNQTAIRFTFREAGHRDCFVAAYIAPYVPTSRLANPISSGLAGSETNVSLDVTSRSFISGAEFGRSVLIGSVPLLGTPTTSVSPERNNPNDGDGAETFEPADDGDGVRKKKR